MPPEHGSTGAVRRAAAQSDYPLTYLQREIWFHCHLPAGAPLHRSGVGATIAGPLDRTLLRRALQAVVDRQSVLRTAIRTVDGVPRQVVLPELAADLFYEDLSGLTEQERFQRLIERFQQIEGEAFDLARAPLWRAALLRANAEEHVLAFFFHHIIVDVFHSSAIVAEVAATYCRFANGDLTPPSPLALEYRDYAVWLDERQQAGGDAEGERYWLEQMRASRSDLLIPRDRPAPATRRFTVEGLIRDVDPAVAEALVPLARQCRATPYGLLLATFAILLGRLTGAREAFVGQPFSTRPRELQDVAGMYANPLPIRTRLDPRQPFRQLVSGVRRELDAARRWRECSLMDAVRRLCLDGEVASVAPVRVSMSHVGSIDMRFPGFRVTQTPSVFGATHPYDLWLGVKERTPGISLTFGFATELFTLDSVQRFADGFVRLLADAVAHPDRAIGDLEMQSEAARAAVLGASVGRGHAPPHDASVAERFERQARLTPAAPAVSMGTETLTYAELDARATRLARRLRHHGVGQGARVALLAQASIEACVGMIAALKAGGAYVPIEPDTPPARLGALLSAIDAAALLTVRSLRGQAVPAAGHAAAPLLCLDEEATAADVDAPAEAALHAPCRSDAPSDTHGGAQHGPSAHAAGSAPSAAAASPALVLLASGSSALPRAIVVPHRALLRLAQHAAEQTIGRGDLLLQASSLASDLAPFEIWGALLNGAHLLVGSDAADAGGDGPTLARAIARAPVPITTLVLSTAAFEALVDAAPEALPALRTLIVHGGAASVPHLRRARAAWPAARVSVTYGPPEQSTLSTWQPIEQVPDDAPSIRIGRPVGQAAVYVLDEQLRPLPIKVKGDLYVGGDGLAAGYLGRPDETAARFVPSPFGSGERLFRTGDVARWHGDGSLELLGVAEPLLVRHGRRIDPREVEAVLEACDGVRRAAVVPAARAKDGPLLAFITTDGRDISAALQDRIAGWLPPHCRPSRCVVRDTLPVTADGAIDRQQLAAVAADVDQAPLAADADLLPQIGAVWRDVLGLARLGPDDNFFEIGGDSIACVRIAARLRARGLPIRERDFFDHQTLTALAACLWQRRRVEAPAARARVADAGGTALVDDDELVGLLAGGGEA